MRITLEQVEIVKELPPHWSATWRRGRHTGFGSSKAWWGALWLAYRRMLSQEELNG